MVPPPQLVKKASQSSRISAPRAAAKAAVALRNVPAGIAAGANAVKSVFSRDMCVAENTSRAASVGFVRLRRAKPARGSLHPSRKSGAPLFRQSQRRRTAPPLSFLQVVDVHLVHLAVLPPLFPAGRVNGQQDHRGDVPQRQRRRQRPPGVRPRHHIARQKQGVQQRDGRQHQPRPAALPPGKEDLQQDKKIPLAKFKDKPISFDLKGLLG